MKTHVKLSPVEYEELVAEWHEFEVTQPDKCLRKIIHRIWGKPMPKANQDRRRCGTPSGFVDFLKTVKSVFCLDLQRIRHTWTMDPEGWLEVDRQNWAEKVKVCPRTVGRYFYMMELKGLIERRCVKREDMFVWQIRFRWDNYNRFCAGEDPSEWIKEERKEKSYPGTGEGESPDAFARPSTTYEERNASGSESTNCEEIENSGKKETEADSCHLQVSVSTSSNNPVDVAVAPSTGIISGSEKEVRPGSAGKSIPQNNCDFAALDNTYTSKPNRFPVTEHAHNFQKVLDIMIEIYGPDVWEDFGRIKRLNRWVNHIMPIYRLTVEKAEKILENIGFGGLGLFDGKLPDVDSFLKYWTKWAKKMYCEELEDKVSAARDILKYGSKSIWNQWVARVWDRIGILNNI